MSWQTMRPVEQLYHQGVPIEMPEGEAWFQNDAYIASVRRQEHPQEYGEVLTTIHISFRRQDRSRSTERDWRDTQRIKNDLVGPEQEMVEMYPAESRVVDTADQYHLWGVEGVELPFGFPAGLRMDADERLIEGTTQRPFE